MAKYRNRRKVVYGRKSDQVLDGALRIFKRDGYSGASVEEVAEIANVAKATVYSYFPSKNILFRRVMKRSLSQEEAGPLASIDLDLPATSGLYKITYAISWWLNAGEEAQLFRLAARERRHFPTICQKYRERMTILLEHPLSEVLKIYVKRGELEIENTAMSSRQLIRLCDIIERDYGVIRRTTPREWMINGNAQTAAEMFLRAYKPPSITLGSIR